MGYVLLFTAVMFVVLGVLIKHLKCYWLISGYNTMSAERKKNVDVVGLANLIGYYCYFLAALFVVAWLFGQLEYHTPMLAVFIIMGISAIFLIIRAQKYDHNKKLGNKDSTSLQAAKKGISITVIILIAVGGFIFYGMQPPTINATENYIQIKGMYSEKVYYQDITDITISETMPKVIRKSNGLNAGNVLKGSFQLQELGKTKLNLNKAKPPYIFIEHNDGLLIINAYDTERTKELFQSLQKYWSPSVGK